MMNTPHSQIKISKHQAPEKKKRLLLCFLLGLMMICPRLLQAQSKTENIRVSLTPEGEVRVGQRVTLAIDLMTTTWFSGSPVFDLPEVPGTVILKVGSFGVNRTETVDGIKYSVQGHEFAIFIQRAGEFVIEPFNVRFFPAGPGAAKPRDVTLKTPKLTIKATMPPGAENLTSLISTNRLDVSETWDPTPETAKVGDAFTRKITMRAEDVLGMAFPPLKNPVINGIGIYSREPSVSDKMDRGNFTGERTETITYVCEEAGTVTLPEVVIHWWDLEREELKAETLPAVTLKINPNPQLIKEDDAIAPFSSRGATAPRLIFMAAILTACLGAFYKFRAPVIRVMKRWKTARDESETAYFRQLKSACRAGNPTGTYKSLLSWLDRIYTGEHAATLNWLVANADSPLLSEQVGLLSGELFHSPSPGTTSWDAKVFLRGLTKARKRLLKRREFCPGKNRLTALNPS